MKRTLINTLESKLDSSEPLMINGWVQKIRNKGKIAFVDVKDRTGTVQVVIESKDGAPIDIKRYDIVSFNGTSVASQVKSGIPGVEFLTSNYEVLSSPESEYPIPITPKSQIKIEQELDHRVISVRNPKNNVLFNMQSDVVQYFAEFLRLEGFTQIFSPKIVSEVAESGANMFELQYFDRSAYLTQSPQLYKQIMVGSGLERVFEVAPVFRAERHNTSRHLNEYISMDLEMGFIDSFHDIMDLEENMLKYVITKVSEKYGSAIKELFGVDIRVPNTIPRIPLAEAIELVQEHYGKKNKMEGDVDPQTERLITKYVQEERDSDFVFLTHYPTKKRPFYTMPNTEDPSVTESFDLVYNGLEITTGGQRIHNYQQLLDNLKVFGVGKEGLMGYLDAFKYGMPPHGGLGLGLERLTAQILGLDNIKRASAFPRDQKRLNP